jgi:chemotaxis protein MotB
LHPLALLFYVIWNDCSVIVMMKKIIYIIAGAALLGSCVPPGEFTQLSEKSNSLQKERDELMAENEFLTVENREMRSKIDRVEEQQEQLVEDSIRIYNRLEELENEVARLERQYADLESTHDALLRGNARETRRLLNELQTTQEDLARKEQLLKDLESNVTLQRQDVNKLQAELEARNARLMEMEAMLSEKDRVLDELKSKVADALMGFEGQGLTITRKDGKVYVSLEEKLLFQSGSTVVDPNGVRALKQLAVVLGNNPDIKIMIEGHTDDVPFRKGSSIKDNWDLSVMRATSIVRILLENSRIDPTRITVAGRGEFLPVDPADTPEARRKNRRTEIILSPDFTELFKILDM